MLHPESWKFVRKWSRRNAGAHTWAPMSPPVGVVSSKIRSRAGDSGLRWTTIIITTVVVTNVAEVTSTRTIRSVLHGRCHQATGRRTTLATIRCTSDGATSASSASSASPCELGVLELVGGESVVGDHGAGVDLAERLVGLRKVGLRHSCSWVGLRHSCSWVGRGEFAVEPRSERFAVGDLPVGCRRLPLGSGTGLVAHRCCQVIDIK